jgi:hypothetical protein
MSVREVRLADGEALRDGGNFWAAGEDGVVESFGPAQVFPPGRIFEDAEVVACGRRWSLTRDRLYATRAAAVAGEVAHREAMLTVRLEALKREEAALKRLYAQRAELEQWAAARPGREVAP